MLKASTLDNEENWATYASWLDPNYYKSEFKVQNIARVANKYADASMNASYDQVSYLDNNIFPIMYFYKCFQLNCKVHFSSLQRVVHTCPFFAQRTAPFRHSTL
jgi:hypothetical protein